MSEAKWYVVHTYSGYENKVKANIRQVFLFLINFGNFFVIFRFFDGFIAKLHKKDYNRVNNKEREGS